MIEFRQVYFRYVSEFFSLYDYSCVIDNHTLFVGDFFDGTNALMRILSKIDNNYKGEVFIDDVNLKNIKDKDLPIAYLPENPVLFQNKNVFKNLYFPLKIRKFNENNAKNMIKNVFSELKNNNFNFLNNFENIKDNDILKLKVKKLSFSEQKILALIRAILRKPKYILLENFFKNLDNTHTLTALHLIKKLKHTSTIVACEKDENTLKDFKIINLNEDKEKKED